MNGLHNFVKNTFYSLVGDSNSKCNNMAYSESVNGLMLKNYYIPAEIVADILSFVSWDDLKSCRLVCRRWKSIIDTLSSFEKLKKENLLRSSFTGSVDKLNPDKIPFYMCYKIGKSVFGTNHLKNPFGEDGASHTCRPMRTGDYWQFFYRHQPPPKLQNCTDDCPKFKHWTITLSQGDGWIVEDTPVGSQPLPEELGASSCFVSSFGPCHKEQCITLSECGLSHRIMDSVRPHIEVSEWYAKRFDCGIVYTLQVSLLDSSKEVVGEPFSQTIEDVAGDDEWHQVSHTFKNYGEGVRYILFHHEGKDTQFWKGHYGSKMAGGSVIARIPSELFERDW